MKKEYFGDTLLFIATLVWGTSFFVTKSVLNNDTPPFTLNMYRALISFLILTPIFFKKILMIKFELIHIKYGFTLGFYIFMGFALQTIGQNYTTPGKSAFLTTLNVVFVPIILFIIYKKRMNSYHVVAVITALLGAFLMSGFSVQVDAHYSNEWLGDFLTILSAIFWAIQIIKTGYYAKEVNIWILMFYEFLMMFILSTISMFVFRETPSVSTESIIGIGYLAIFCTVISFYLMTVGLKYTSPEKASLIFIFEGVFGTIFSVLFKMERISVPTILGGSIIFLALVISETKLTFLNKFIKGKKLLKRR